MKTKLPILYFTFLLYTACCFEDVTCTHHDIYLPLSLQPAQETYQLNDTIRVNADFGEELLDSVTLTSITLNASALWNVMYLVSIDTVGTPDAFPDFELQADSLAIRVYPYLTSLRYVTFFMVEGRFKLDFKLIPKQAGLYLLGFWAGNTHNYIDKKCCEREDIYEYMDINNGAQNNYQMLALSPDTTLQQIPFSSFRNNGNFVFRVTE